MKILPVLNPNHLALLSALCNLPTAPYFEQHVIAFLLAWAKPHAPFLTRRVALVPAPMP